MACLLAHPKEGEGASKLIFSSADVFWFETLACPRPLLEAEGERGGFRRMSNTAKPLSFF